MTVNFKKHCPYLYQHKAALIFIFTLTVDEISICNVNGDKLIKHNSAVRLSSEGPCSHFYLVVRIYNRLNYCNNYYLGFFSLFCCHQVAKMQLQTFGDYTNKLTLLPLTGSSSGF